MHIHEKKKKCGIKEKNLLIKADGEIGEDFSPAAREKKFWLHDTHDIV